MSLGAAELAGRGSLVVAQIPELGFIPRPQGGMFGRDVEGLEGPHSPVHLCVWASLGLRGLGQDGRRGT